MINLIHLGKTQRESAMLILTRKKTCQDSDALKRLDTSTSVYSYLPSMRKTLRKEACPRSHYYGCLSHQRKRK
jgi:hypothetical protein